MTRKICTHIWPGTKHRPLWTIVKCTSLRPPEPTRYLQNNNTSMAIKQGLLLCRENGVLRNKSGYRTDIEREILNPTWHIYINHPLLLGTWRQRDNDVLKLYIQNAYTILVTTTKNQIKWSSKGGFGLISSTHTIPRHTVHGLDTVLYNILPTSKWLTALRDKTMQIGNIFLAQY